MTDDSRWERGSPEEDFEVRRARELHRLERWVARQPGRGPDRPDPITIVRIVIAGNPRQHTYWLMRFSLAARLVRDAEGSADEVADLGPGALMLCQAAQRGDWRIGEMALIGVARDGKWVTWLPPAPVEPVPGSAGDAAQRN
jgi:hypothetical protein